MKQNGMQKQRHMRLMKNLSLALILPLLLAACATVPITGRTQISLIPASTMLALSNQEYGSFLQQNKLSNNRNEQERVKRVGTKLQAAVERYFRSHGLAAQLRNYSWEFNLVEDETPNAWCMPGGKIVIYTGILPYTQTDAGLAVVMAHEIAHAVAGHGNERMSQSLLTQMGGMALQSALGSHPEKTRSLWMAAYGIGSQLAYVLPYSRLQEYEADKLGLVFMAMAGYQPSEAIGFWKRMMAKSGSSHPPEFLSTHPSDTARIRQIEAFIPEAMTYYRNQKLTTHPLQGGEKW